MLGEDTATVTWNFAVGGTRQIRAVFMQPVNPQLQEESFERTEMDNIVLFVPYDDTNGVSTSDRNDWVTVRGVDYDVVSYGSKDGGNRRIELKRTIRLHETAQQVFGVSS
jgi:hypothetical protein